MRSKTLIAILVMSGMALMVSVEQGFSKDYNSRFVRNYPPGYYGMWYNADRFHDRKTNESGVPVERYRWDSYMTRIVELDFPWRPIPFDWEYGSNRDFNLPNYNTNDWN